jgi:putative transposase
VFGYWYSNLGADIAHTGPKRLWDSSLTYVRLERTFVFLAVVLDVFSNKVTGYTLGPTLDARVRLAAVDVAVESRRTPIICVHRSDRGSQHSTKRYREHLAEAGLPGSMSGASNRSDNAQVDCFMKTPKHEEIYPRGYRTMADVTAYLLHLLEVTYSNNQQHSALSYQSPKASEADHSLTLSSG